MSATLYQRLGGADGIASLVEEAVAKHLANPLVKSRFENVEDLERAKEMSREFFSVGSGGPGPYSGRDMRTAHKGMNISEQEFLAVTDDIVITMDEHGLDDETKKDVIAILYSLKDEIIRQ